MDTQDDDSFFAPRERPRAAPRYADMPRLVFHGGQRNPEGEGDADADADESAADATFFGIQPRPAQPTQQEASTHVTHSTHSTHTSPQPTYDTSFPDESYEEYPENEIELESYDTESSNVFDPDQDPEGWAERIDELAGVLEMSQAEARAIRWGPAIGPERDAPDLSVEDFETLLNYHLENTDWRFDESAGVAEERGGDGGPSFLDTHPISVFGRGWGGREVGLQLDATTAMRQLALENGVGV